MRLTHVLSWFPRFWNWIKINKVLTLSLALILRPMDRKGREGDVMENLWVLYLDTCGQVKGALNNCVTKLFLYIERTKHHDAQVNRSWKLLVQLFFSALESSNSVSIFILSYPHLTLFPIQLQAANDVLHQPAKVQENKLGLDVSVSADATPTNATDISTKGG